MDRTEGEGERAGPDGGEQGGNPSRRRRIATLVGLTNVGVGAVGATSAAMILLPAAGMPGFGGSGAPEATMMAVWGLLGATLVLAGGLTSLFALRGRPALAFPSFFAAGAGGFFLSMHHLVAAVPRSTPAGAMQPLALTPACGLTVLSIFLGFASLWVAFSTRSLSRRDEAPLA